MTKGELLWTALFRLTNSLPGTGIHRVCCCAVALGSGCSPSTFTSTSERGHKADLYGRGSPSQD